MTERGMAPAQGDTDPPNVPFGRLGRSVKSFADRRPVAAGIGLTVLTVALVTAAIIDLRQVNDQPAGALMLFALLLMLLFLVPPAWVITKFIVELAWPRREPVGVRKFIPYLMFLIRGTLVFMIFSVVADMTPFIRWLPVPGVDGIDDPIVPAAMNAALHSVQLWLYVAVMVAVISFVGALMALDSRMAPLLRDKPKPPRYQPPWVGKYVTRVKARRAKRVARHGNIPEVEAA